MSTHKSWKFFPWMILLNSLCSCSGTTMDFRVGISLHQLVYKVNLIGYHTECSLFSMFCDIFPVKTSKAVSPVEEDGEVEITERSWLLGERIFSPCKRWDYLCYVTKCLPFLSCAHEVMMFSWTICWPMSVSWHVLAVSWLSLPDSGWIKLIIQLSLLMSAVPWIWRGPWRDVLDGAQSIFVSSFASARELSSWSVIGNLLTNKSFLWTTTTVLKDRLRGEIFLWRDCL
jgi:hypothetical protein